MKNTNEYIKNIKLYRYTNMCTEKLLANLRDLPCSVCLLFLMRPSCADNHARRILINWFRRSINLGDNGYVGGGGVKGWGYSELAIQLPWRHWDHLWRPQVTAHKRWPEVNGGHSETLRGKEEWPPFSTAAHPEIHSSCCHVERLL